MAGKMNMLMHADHLKSLFGFIPLKLLPLKTPKWAKWSTGRKCCNKVRFSSL